MDLKHIENRMEGLTRHLLALADEAQHVIARADAQVSALAQAATAAEVELNRDRDLNVAENGPARVLGPSLPLRRLRFAGVSSPEVVRMAAAPAARGCASSSPPGVSSPLCSHTMSGTGSGGGDGARPGLAPATATCATAATTTTTSLTFTAASEGDANATPQPCPHAITLCLEPLRERADAALTFLYEDPKAVHRGITYMDYPGSDRAEKRMNFAMFRRGLHGFNRHCVGLEGRALKQRLHKLSEQNRENGKKHKGTKRPRG